MTNLSSQRIFVACTIFLVLTISMPGHASSAPLTNADLHELIDANVSESVILTEVQKRGISEPLTIDTIVSMSEHLSVNVQKEIIALSTKKKVEEIPINAQLCMAFDQKDRDRATKLANSISPRDLKPCWENTHVFYGAYNLDWYDIGELFIREDLVGIRSFRDSYGSGFLDYAYTSKKHRWVDIFEAAGFTSKSSTRKNYYRNSPESIAKRQAERQAKKDRSAALMEAITVGVVSGIEAGTTGQDGMSVLAKNMGAGAQDVRDDETPSNSNKSSSSPDQENADDPWRNRSFSHEFNWCMSADTISCMELEFLEHRDNKYSHSLTVDIDPIEVIDRFEAGSNNELKYTVSLTNNSPCHAWISGTYIYHGNKVGTWDIGSLKIAPGKTKSSQDKYFRFDDEARLEFARVKITGLYENCSR